MPSRSPAHVQHPAVESTGGGLTYVLRQCLAADVSLAPTIFVALPGRGHPSFDATEKDWLQSIPRGIRKGSIA